MYGDGRIDHAAHDILGTVDKGFSFVLFVIFVVKPSSMMYRQDTRASI